MIWKDFSKKFRDGEHAFLGASNHAWYNYDDEKLVRIYINKLAASRGTAIHALACSLIKLKTTLPENGSTLSLYVNDAIKLGLRPEEKLFYTKFAYGTADGIDFKDGILRVSDLKTGKTKALNIRFVHKSSAAWPTLLSIHPMKPIVECLESRITY